MAKRVLCPLVKAAKTKATPSSFDALSVQYASTPCSLDTVCRDGVWTTSVTLKRVDPPAAANVTKIYRDLYMYSIEIHVFARAYKHTFSKQTPVHVRVTVAVDSPTRWEFMRREFTAFSWKLGEKLIINLTDIVDNEKNIYFA